MRFWIKGAGKEEECKVIELFPQLEETGQTVMMSKDSGLVDSILAAAKEIDEPEDPSS